MMVIILMSLVLAILYMYMNVVCLLVYSWLPSHHMYNVHVH